MKFTQMSNIINKIQNKLPGIKREYEQKIHFYNPATAAYYSVAMYLCKFGIRKHQGILEELPKRISATLEKYSSQRSNIQEEIPDDCPIWMMWWQGVDEMPPIVKRCYQSVLKHRGNHPVMLLDRNNYQEYIEITPPHIREIEV